MADVSDALRVVVGLAADEARLREVGGGQWAEAYHHFRHMAAALVVEHGAALAQALENDARYRVVRVMLGVAGNGKRPIDCSGCTPETLDAAIDSAIAAQQKEAGRS